MLIIVQNSVNNVVTNASENQQTSGVTFLFEVTSISSNVSTYFLSANVSAYQRYARFCITETSGVTNPLSGVTSFPLKGQYKYNIYESPLKSLSPVGLLLVETGRLLVLGPEPATVKYDQDRKLNFYQKT